MEDQQQNLTHHEQEEVEEEEQPELEEEEHPGIQQHGWDHHAQQQVCDEEEEVPEAWQRTALGSLFAQPVCLGVSTAVPVADAVAA